MPPKPGRKTPEKTLNSPKAFIDRPLTEQEDAVVVQFVRDLPRSALDPQAADSSVNLMLVAACEKLATAGYANFRQLNINEPESGGLKFTSLKTRIQELLEEYGATRENLPSFYGSPVKTITEGAKTPEKNISPKNNRFVISPKNKSSSLIEESPQPKENPQSMEKPDAGQISPAKESIQIHV